MQVESDALGWGLVVRGNGPCHIQAVEPHGPAAVAGMKVGIMENDVQCSNVRLFGFHLYLNILLCCCISMVGLSKLTSLWSGTQVRQNIYKVYIYLFSFSPSQVCQFVVSINYQSVVDMDYKSISQLIRSGPRKIVMEVMEEKQH